MKKVYFNFIKNNNKPILLNIFFQFIAVVFTILNVFIFLILVYNFFTAYNKNLNVSLMNLNNFGNNFQKEEVYVFLPNTFNVLKDCFKKYDLNKLQILHNDLNDLFNNLNFVLPSHILKIIEEAYNSSVEIKSILIKQHEKNIFSVLINGIAASNSNFTSFVSYFFKNKFILDLNFNVLPNVLNNANKNIEFNLNFNLKRKYEK